MNYDRGLLKETLSKEQWRHFKRTGELPESFVIPSIEPEPIITDINERITVLCVRFGTKYGPEYVEKLRNMVARHLTVPYEFCCLTDDQTPIEGVTSIVRPNEGYPKGWWHKVHMFDPNLGLKGRVLYMDLDVIIHSNINKLIANQGNQFLGIRDFNRKFNPTWNILNSSVMSWPAGLHPDIYTVFKTDPKKAQRMHGDQDWIWHVAKSRITFWSDRWIQSYKWEIRDRSEILYSGNKRVFKTVRNVAIPRDCSICVFHGDPNPHEVQDPYVLDNWR
jgi:hypothetical protein